MAPFGLGLSPFSLSVFGLAIVHCAAQPFAVQSKTQTKRDATGGATGVNDQPTAPAGAVVEFGQRDLKVAQDHPLLAEVRADGADDDPPRGAVDPFDDPEARTPKYVQRAIRKAIADTAANTGLAGLAALLALLGGVADSAASFLESVAC